MALAWAEWQGKYWKIRIKVGCEEAVDGAEADWGANYVGKNGNKYHRRGNPNLVSWPLLLVAGPPRILYQAAKRLVGSRISHNMKARMRAKKRHNSENTIPNRGQKWTGEVETRQQPLPGANSTIALRRLRTASTTSCATGE